MCTAKSASEQWRARRHGIAGIYGNPGIVESATYTHTNERSHQRPADEPKA
jgi:hypothetical protein